MQSWGVLKLEDAEIDHTLNLLLTGVKSKTLVQMVSVILRTY